MFKVFAYKKKEDLLKLTFTNVSESLTLSLSVRVVPGSVIIFSVDPSIVWII